MIIYVVKSGDTIYLIASRYQVYEKEIIEVNKLHNPNNLVVGQALIIPVTTYTVNQGENLYEISNKLGVPYRDLIYYNNLDINFPLYKGQIINIPQVQKTNIFSNAYIDTYSGTQNEIEMLAREKTPYLSYLAPFAYTVTRDGTLIPPPLYNLPQIAKNSNTALMLVIANTEVGKGFSEELGRIIVTDEKVQDKILEQVIYISKEIGYQDVHFDLEFLPVDTREDYNQFLRKAKAVLSKNNLLLSTALAPKVRSDQVGQWYEAHDYKAHGEIADFVILMTYEWGYTYGLPMPVSPIGPVRRVVEYALSVMPADKIMLGQNLYGYDWTAPYKKNASPAQTISPNRAIEIAWENNQSILYDKEAEAPYFHYTDKQGKMHTVWFEDARSVRAKFNLIREYKLRGISYWRLGYEFPQNWYMLNNEFNIKKLI